VDFFGGFPKLGKLLTAETLTVLSKKRWLIQTLKKSDLVYISDIKQAHQTTLQISKRNGKAAKALISETAAAIWGKKTTTIWTPATEGTPAVAGMLSKSRQKMTTIKIEKVLVDLLNSCRFVGVALHMGRNAAGSTM
jgi:hypothetical protein